MSKKEKVHKYVSRALDNLRLLKQGPRDNLVMIDRDVSLRIVRDLKKAQAVLNDMLDQTHDVSKISQTIIELIKTEQSVEISAVIKHLYCNDVTEDIIYSSIRALTENGQLKLNQDMHLVIGDVKKKFCS